MKRLVEVVGDVGGDSGDAVRGRGDEVDGRDVRDLLAVGVIEVEIEGDSVVAEVLDVDQRRDDVAG